MRGHVRKRGSKWTVVVDLGKVDGKRKQKWYSGFKGSKEAEKFLTDVLSKMDKNEFVDPSKLTVKDYLQNWFESYCLPNLAASTYDSYRTILYKHIIPQLGKILLQKLQPMDIQKYYGKATKEGRVDGKGGLSNKTVNYHHRVLRQALDQALRLQLITRNPADAVEAPKPKKYYASFLNEQNIDEFLIKLKGTRLEWPATLAVALGLRRGEALGLRWCDVDLERKLLTVNQTLLPTNEGLLFKEPKSRESKRTLALPAGIVSILKVKQAEAKLKFGQAFSDSQLIYCDDIGNPIHPSSFGHWFRDWCKDNGFEGLRFHDLRHTNATLMLKAKIHPKVASQRLGHSTTGITMDLYSHIMESMQEEVADKIDEILWKKKTSK